MKLEIISILLITVLRVSGFSKFRLQIPNGLKVPNPCYCVAKEQPKIWPGVGHKNIGGGGALNPFGEVGNIKKKLIGQALFLSIFKCVFHTA